LIIIKVKPLRHGLRERQELVPVASPAWPTLRCQKPMAMAAEAFISDKLINGFSTIQARVLREQMLHCRLLLLMPHYGQERGL
jgi:hypothetical protein